MMWRNFQSLLFCCLLVVATSACTKSSDDNGDFDGDFGNGDSPPPVNLDQRALSAMTNEDGIANFSFTVDPAVTGYQLLVSSGVNRSQLVALSDSQGEVSLVPLAPAFQGPLYLSTSVNALNFPFSPFNVMRTSYTASYKLIDSTTQNPLPFTELSATLLTKKDSDLSNGTVGVNMILVGSVGGSSETRDSLQSVLSVAESYLSSAGLSLNVEWVPVPGPDTLPDPNTSNSFYENIVQHTRVNSVNIVFGTEVTGLHNQDAIYSISTGDGGPALPSPRSVAVVSILAVAGPDGLFNYDGDGSVQINGDEIGLAGEEVAQLIGHYLGVTHILENDGFLTTSSDALPDTNSCVTIVDCRNEKDVRGNLMFPFPIYILDENLDTYKRNHLTSQQTTILQSSVLVN